MMKRFFSMLCATAFAISTLLTTAGASENVATQVSPNAGKTVEYLIVMPMPDGQPSKEYTIYVDVPEGATRAEQSAIANQAAMEVAGIAPSRSTRAMGTYVISTQYRKEFHGVGYPAFCVGSGMLEKTFSTLFIELSNITELSGYTTSVNIRVENSKFPGANMYTSESYSPFFPKCIIYMYAGQYYGNGILPLDQGDWIDVYGSTNAGVLQADVTISANV